MSAIHITGWRIGFDKVRMGKFLRKELSLSLIESHAMVEEILHKREVVVPISPERLQDALNKLEQIGAVCYYEP
jgi:hypothetical protein